ncbi:MAG: SBBP repeat-containing protein [Acidobacteriota bacterium]
MMKYRSRQFFALLALSALCWTVAFLFARLAEPDRPPASGVPATVGPTIRGITTPPLFERNVGQWPADVRFVTRGMDFTVSLSSGQALIARPGGPLLRMAFRGAQPRRNLIGLDPQKSKTHYLIGTDPKAWHTHVPHFGRVLHQEVYPGIDLVYYYRGGRLEFDFHVKPGVNPSLIRLAFDERLQLDSGGRLVVGAGRGSLSLDAPAVYQERDGVRKSVPGQFVLLDTGTAGFRIGEYDPRRELVIDPSIVFSTYFGGKGGETVSDVAIGHDDYVYIAGQTDSTDLPDGSGALKRSGGANGFVAKFTPAGALVYIAYIGGSGTDGVSGIAIDAANNVFVTGGTYSDNFPTTAGAYKTQRQNADVFVAKIGSNGASLVYSTLLGGSSTESSVDIVVDSDGQATVEGQTFSSDFPTFKAHQSSRKGDRDIFVTRFNRTGNALLFSTYLGGVDDDQTWMEAPGGIGIDSAGNIYVTGATSADDFPVKDAYQGTRRGSTDLFVTSFTPEGVLRYSTYLGGSDEDECGGLAVGTEGSAFVISGTLSTLTFPTTAGVYQAKGRGFRDVVISKLQPDGKSLGYSTFVSGTDFDTPYGVAVDQAGNAYVTGYAAAGFPQVDSIQPAIAKGSGRYDTFVFKLNSQGSTVLFSSYLGGGDGDEGKAIAVDSHGAVYAGGITHSPDFPVKNAYQATYANTANADPWGPGDGFLTCLDLTPSTMQTGNLLGPIADLAWTRFARMDADANGLPDASDTQFQVLHDGNKLQFIDPRTDLVPGLSTVEFSNLDPITGYHLTAIRRALKDTGDYQTLTVNIDGFDSTLRPVSVTVSELVEPAGKAPNILTGRAYLLDANQDGVYESFVVERPGQPAVTIDFVWIDINQDGKPDFITIPWAMAQVVAIETDPGNNNFQVYIPLADTNGDGTPDAPALDFDHDQKPDPGCYFPFVGGTAQPADEHRLYFPQFANGGDLVSSQIMLVNLDQNHTAQVHLSFKNGPGNPLPMNLDGQATTGEHDTTIPPGGLRVMRTDGKGEVVAGSATVISDRALFGVILYGGVIGMAGVGSAAVMPQGFVAPVERNAVNQLDTGVAVMNLENQQVECDFTLTNNQGVVQAQALDVMLPPNGQTALFIHQYPWNPPVDFSNFSGLLKATTSGPVAATVIQMRGNKAEISASPVARYFKPVAGSNAEIDYQGAFPYSLLFPQFAGGVSGGVSVSSQLVVANLDGAHPANVRVTLKDDPGAALSVDLNGTAVTGTHNLTVPAGGAAVLKTDGQDDLVVGSACVDSDRPLAGVIVYESLGTAGVGAGAALKNGFLAPFEVNLAAGLSTGLAIMNPGTQPVLVQLELGETTEALTATMPAFTIPPGGHWAQMVDLMPWIPAVDFSKPGILRATCNGTVAATVIRTQYQLGQFATLPVAPLVQ